MQPHIIHIDNHPAPDHRHKISGEDQDYTRYAPGDSGGSKLLAVGRVRWETTSTERSREQSIRWLQVKNRDTKELGVGLLK